MYAQGIGVEQDNKTAIEFFARGAQKGHAPSENGLGFMHMHGYGVKQVRPLQVRIRSLPWEALVH